MSVPAQLYHIWSHLPHPQPQSSPKGLCWRWSGSSAPPFPACRVYSPLTVSARPPALCLWLLWLLPPLPWTVHRPSHPGQASAASGASLPEWMFLPPELFISWAPCGPCSPWTLLSVICSSDPKCISVFIYIHSATTLLIMFTCTMYLYSTVCLYIYINIYIYILFLLLVQCTLTKFMYYPLLILTADVPEGAAVYVAPFGPRLFCPCCLLYSMSPRWQ